MERCGVAEQLIYETNQPAGVPLDGCDATRPFCWIVGFGQLRLSGNGRQRSADLVRCICDEILEILDGRRQPMHKLVQRLYQGKNLGRHGSLQLAERVGLSIRQFLPDSGQRSQGQANAEPDHQQCKKRHQDDGSEGPYQQIPGELLARSSCLSDLHCDEARRPGSRQLARQGDETNLFVTIRSVEELKILARWQASPLEFSAQGQREDRNSP